MEDWHCLNHWRWVAMLHLDSCVCICVQCLCICVPSYHCHPPPHPAGCWWTVRGQKRWDPESSTESSENHLSSTCRILQERQKSILHRQKRFGSLSQTGFRWAFHVGNLQADTHYDHKTILERILSWETTSLPENRAFVECDTEEFLQVTLFLSFADVRCIYVPHTVWDCQFNFAYYLNI